MCRDFALFTGQAKRFNFNRVRQTEAGFKFQLDHKFPDGRYDSLLFSFDYQPQQPGDAQSFAQGNLPAQFFINQQQVGIRLLGQHDGFGFPPSPTPPPAAQPWRD